MSAVAAPALARQDPAVLMDDLYRWLEVHWLQIAVAVGAGVLIYLVLNFARSVIGRLCRREHIPGLLSVAGRAALRTSHIFMIIVAARLVAGYANPPELMLRTIQFFFTVITAFQVAVWLREIIVGMVELRSGHEGSETLSNAMGIIRILVSVAVFAIATVVVLDNLGVNVTGLVAGLGIGGIAIGLAAQGIFSDLFAALSILFDRPFKQGEIITYDQTTARVERIGLKSTRLRATSGERKIVSNANLLQKEITSLQSLAIRRVKFALGIIYQTPVETIDRLPQILREVVESQGQVFIHAGMVAFGASSLDFEMEFDVPDPDDADYFMTRHRVALALLRRFNEEGIEFAYPTQTSFTAAPDGTLIMPYPQSSRAKAPA
jgi:small-conductance mechanosensitive channel